MKEKSSLYRIISNLLFVFNLPVIVLVAVRFGLYLILNIKSQDDYDRIVPFLISDIVRVYYEYKLITFIISLCAWILIFI